MTQSAIDSIVFLIFWLGCGIIACIIHKRKGYSPITGFLWGLTIVGVVYVLVEKTKKENDEEKAKNILTMGQWMALFMGIGILCIILFFVVVNSLISNNSKEQNNPYQHINIDFSTNGYTDDNNEIFHNLYYYIDTTWVSYTNDDGSLSYKKPRTGGTLNVSYNNIGNSDIESFMSGRFKKDKEYKLMESKKVNINNFNWNMYYYQIDDKDCKVFYITDYNNKRYELEFTFKKDYQFSDSVQEMANIMNTMVFK